MGAPATRRCRTLLAALTALAALLLAAAPQAAAHAVLQYSTPAAASATTSGDSPSTVVLTFDEPVAVGVGAIQVIDAGGSRVDRAQVTHPGGVGSRVSVGLHSHLPEGSYLVLWRVVSADSHPVHGSFTFAVGHPGAVATASVVSSPLSLTVALGVARFAGYVGLLLLVGVMSFLACCQPSSWTDARTRRLASAAVVTAVIATALGYAGQATVDAGGGWSSLADVSTLSALASTRLGHAHLLRLACLGLLWFAPSQARTPGLGGRLLVTAIGVVLLITVAVEGHGGRTAYTSALDTVHLAAAASWLGGLVVLLAVVLPTHRRAVLSPAQRVDEVEGRWDVPTEDLQPAPLHQAHPTQSQDESPAAVAVLDRPPPIEPTWAPVRRFSAVAAISVAALATTGTLQSLRQVGEWGALTGTGYGRLLLVKLGLVAATLVVAAASTTILHTHLVKAAPHRRARLLMLTVAAETSVLVAVLAVTTALVASAPAGTSYRPAQDLTVQAGPDTVEVSALAPAARTLDLHLYIYGADGVLADVPSLTAEASPPAGTSGLGPVTVQLVHAGTGHFIAGSLLLPEAGRWAFTLRVQTSQFESVAATTSLTVR